MNTVIHTVALLFWLAQTPSFEVASVKPSVYRTNAVFGERGAGGGCPTAMRTDQARVEITCATLPMLIGYAYRHSPDRVKGPGWMTAAGSQRFDISAKLPPGAVRDQIPEMLQALLAERFKLVLHQGSTRGETYALVVERGGLKVAPGAPLTSLEEPGGASASTAFYGAVQERTDGSAIILTNPRMGTVRQMDGPNSVQRWEAPDTTLEGLADLLDKEMPVSIPIVDMTGVKGRYALTLETSVVAAFNAGLHKLGLRLERRKGRVATLVVDRVEKAPAEN
jgi:uncharacterized protein (TIGR03435 family)